MAVKEADYQSKEPTKPYRIIASRSSADLEKLVVDAMKDGLVPLGAPFPYGQTLCQAMQSGRLER